MEVKKAGKYKTRNGRNVEIYGFDDLASGTMFAEGFFEDTRKMNWWDPETGKCAHVEDPQNDLIEISE